MNLWNDLNLMDCEHKNTTYWFLIGTTYPAGLLCKDCGREVDLLAKYLKKREQEELEYQRNKEFGESLIKAK